MDGLRRVVAVLIGLALALPAGAIGQDSARGDYQTAAPGAAAFELSVRNIMRGPEHVGVAPSAVRWTEDGRWLYFRWQPGGAAWDEPVPLYRIGAEGGSPERLSEEVADSLAVLLAPGDVSPDERLKTVSHLGDLYLIDRSSLEVRQLTGTRARDTSPVFRHDGRALFFVRYDNVYELELDGPLLRQLTDIRVGPEAREEEAEGQRAFLEQQQLELFESIRRDAERERRERERRERRESAAPPVVRLDRGEHVRRLVPDRGGGFVVLEIGRPARDARRTLVPDYVTASAYTENLEVRTKVGDAQMDGRLGLLDLGTRDVRWLDPLAGAEIEASVGGPDDDDDVDDRLAQASFLGWNEGGTLGLITATSYDFKNRWLQVLDPATGELRTIAYDRDDAWIGGPCAGPCAGWMPDGRHVYFVSERSGYSHVYVVGADGAGLRALTSGEWEVHRVELSPDEGRFHLATNEGSPFELHFYHMALDGGPRTRVTGSAGRHDVTVSPDGRLLAVVYSYANRPPELVIAENRPGAGPRPVTRSPTAEWRSFPWIVPEIVRFEARDGEWVPARIYRPADVGSEPTGAAVIFVHGAGYLQNVHNWWSRYEREYMFHHLLASRGYVVLDIDFRASAGYGRDWRTAIYRDMGGKDLSDQVDGAEWLVANEGVDPGRIGIYGGSYGGFITLMALFTEPERFAAGAALRAVTDWAHYNHRYTSRILNLPHGDGEAYHRSSPIHFAEGLSAPLLITHGMVDVNVHYQDVVRLAQRLIELGKEDWELAVYPKEDHEFVDPMSWADQYRRILKLFETHIGGLPAAAEE